MDGKEKERKAIIKRVQENPDGYLTHEETRLYLDVGEDVFRALVRLGREVLGDIPVFANKFNPSDLRRWMYENRKEIRNL